MQYNYKIIPHGTDSPVVREVSLEFEPYENEIAYLDQGKDAWKVTNIERIDRDINKPIVLGSEYSLLVRRFEQDKPMEHMSMEIDLELTPNSNYLITTYVRNNAVTSTKLSLNGEFKDYVADTYTQRICGTVTTDDTGEVNYKLDMYDANGPYDLWVSGFFATKISEEDMNLDKRELLLKYEYVTGKKSSPNMRDLLDDLYHFSPYRYYLVSEGRRISDYNKPLSEYGITEDTIISSHMSDWDEQIFNAFVNDVPLMAMLEGKREHVSHAFPKEDGKMSSLHTSHFPRIQFFTGFAVNSLIADIKPIADEVNFVTNIYIPVTKVMESVSAIMILNQQNAIMAELGWAKIRGSDYFLKNEQLYVLQSQYIQDQMLAMKKI